MAKTINHKRAKKIFFLSIVFAVLLSGLVGFGIGDKLYNGQNNPFINPNQGKPADVDFSLFWQAYSKLKSDYVGTVDPQQFLYGAIAGAYGSLNDPYTVFLTPDLSKSFQDELSGSLEGIGIQIGVLDNFPAVIAPLPGSPAETAGLKAKDLIVKVDGQDSSTMTLDAVVEKIRGQAGTEVSLDIQRQGQAQTINFKIKRANITVTTVDLQYKGDVAVIKLSEFGSDSAGEIQKAVDQISSKGIKKVVLDMRNNPGGLLDGAVNIAGQFFPDGQTVVIEQGKNSREELKTSGPGTLKDVKLAVLVNGGSASAAEILAGAIQDTNRGQVIGEKTFGKGTVQQLESLPNGSSVKITVAKWLTPKGNSIDKNGITPNIEVKEPDNPLFSDTDPLLNKAIEVLK
jgi:carboxyl-terminal processing protease